MQNYSVFFDINRSVKVAKSPSIGRLSPYYYDLIHCNYLFALGTDRNVFYRFADFFLDELNVL